MKFLDSWDWEDTAYLFFWVAVTVIAAVGLTAICADHRVRYYYVRGQDTSLSSCVMADISWYTDDPAFCSADIDKVSRRSRIFERAIEGEWGPMMTKQQPENAHV